MSSDFRLDNAISFAKATNLIKLKTQELPFIKTEIVNLSSALNRFLAIDIIAPMNVPNHRNSAVDGYGIKATDIPVFNLGVPLAVTKRILAGDLIVEDCPDKKVVPIMTGAKIPNNVSSIVMNEEVIKSSVDTGARSIQLKNLDQPLKNNLNVREVGEDITMNSLLFRKGRLLSAADLGVLASLNFTEITVKKKLVIAYFSTGNEIKKIGTELQIGEVYDSNSLLVESMVKNLNYEFINVGIVADNPIDLKKALLFSLEQADVVITSGGVSMGDVDYIRKIFAEIGKIDFWKLAVKPGRPFACGNCKDKLIFGLPGNPTAVMTTFYQLVMPALYYLSSNYDYKITLIKATAKCRLKSLKGRYEFARGFYTQDENRNFIVDTVGKQGSGILTTMAFANCYIHLQDNLEEVKTNETVLIQPFDSFLYSQL